MTISFELSQEQVATNQQKKQEIIDAAQPDLIAGNQFVFFAAFDGTNNDLNTKDPLDTNVAQLWRQYQPNFGGRVGGQYYPGPGTKGTLTASSWLYPQVTEQVVKQAKQAYEDFRDQASSWLRKNPNGSVAVALAAFSRGNASAAIFSQLLFEGGLIDTRSDTVLIAPGQIQLSAGVLFDPVTTGVQGNLAFAPNTRNVIDVLANNEYRQAFKAADYSGQPGITRVSMIGNHSDIGGPYDRGIGALSLEAATTFLQRSGVPVTNVRSDRTFVGNTVLVHDEGLNPNGSQVWSEYGSYLQSTQRLFDAVVTSTPVTGSAVQSLVLYNGDRLTIVTPSPTAPQTTRTESLQRDHTPTVLEMLTGSALIQDIANYYSTNSSFYRAAKADEIIQKLGFTGSTETVTARVFVANDNLPIEIIRKAQTIRVDVKAVNGVKLDSLASSSIGIKPDVDGVLTALSGNTINNSGNNKWIDAASTLYEFTPSTRGQKVGTLTITQGALREDRVVINDFDLAQAQKQGFLGIRLGTLEVTVKPGAVTNPFDDPNFDEASAPAPSSIVADGDANSYTIFLPYAAGDGGQRIHLKLEGADADKLAVIANGETLTVVNGEFDVTITEGERALTFALLDEESVAADAILTLKATLVDAEGNATHQTHTELTLTLQAPEDPTGADQAFTNTISGDQTPAQPDDELYGTAANDKVVAGEGNDYVFADTGKDWVQGGNGSDALFGVQGNDLIEGGAGTDIIGGGEDDDQLYADGKADKAAALASDATTAGSTTDFLDGYSGDDQLVGSTGADTLLGGAGSDLLIAGAGDDFLYGDRDGTYSGTTTTIQATVGDVNPEGSDDTLFGGGGADTMYGEIGDDALFGSAGDDEMYGDAEDLAAASHGDDYIDGGAGNDFLVGGLGNDDVIGGVGDDELFGDSDDFAVALHGDDYLEGGADNDFLAGMGGSDILTGGEGDDELAGGDGDDELYGGEGADQLDAGAGDDYLDAGAGDDIAQGGEGQDTLYGEEGDDQLIGDRGADDPNGGAADWMEGGAGADALFGQGGDDTLFGDEGNDQLVAGMGDDYLDGGEGNDVLLGEAGDDTLAGGAGQDVLIGGAGRDTYVLERGDGQDVAVDSLFAADDPNASVISLGVGISSGDVRLHVGSASIDLGSGATDYVTLVVDAGGGDAIAFAGFDPQNPGAANLFGSLEFADGATLAYASVLDLGFDTAGTDGNDFIEGTALDDRIDGQGGHDTLVGNDGDDVLTGGTGNDELIGGFGKDTYVFNPGDGIDVVEEQSLLAGSADASVLELGTGDFTLRLDIDDSMMVDLGDGDRISLLGFDPERPFDRPVLSELRAAGASYTFDEVLARGFDLDGTSADNVMHGTAVTDRIAGFDGDDRIDGRAGDDTIDGGAGNDIMTGGAGNDTLIGGDGADIMHGGTGDDSIFAGADDVVLDTEGSNHLDLTTFASLSAANLEMTQYEADGGDLYLSLHVRDAAHVGETPESGDVAVQSGETGSFATVTLNDGAGGAVTMSIEELIGQYAAGGFVFAGSDRADTLFGTAYGDSMYGGLGNDEMRGNAGDDELGGGEGDDTLIGGAGNDRYLLGFNTGHDTVVEDGSAEPLSVHTIQLESGITSEVLAGLRIGDDLQVRIEATGDALVIQDFYEQPQSWQDNWLVRDAQGQSVNLTTLLSAAPPPSTDWLADQKAAYRVQREQAFSAGRQADGLGPIGGTSHRRVDYTFNFSGSNTVRRTDIQRLVQGSTSFVHADGSIDTGPFYFPAETVTQSEAITVARPLFGSTGAGRGNVTLGQTQVGATASLPEGAMIWSQKSPFPGFSGYGFEVSAGDVLIPVYGSRIGIPPNNGQDLSGSQYVPPNLNNPAAYELKGWRVHHTSSNQQPVAHETPVVNPTVVVPIATTLDEAFNVPDAVGGDESNNVGARSASIVDAGGGNDIVTLTAENNAQLPDGPDLKALFTVRDWRTGVSADALVDFFSPSDAKYRYLAAHKSWSVRDRQEALLADHASLLGGFVDAGAGNDVVTGSDARDTIAGGDGDDVIDGGGGSDQYLYTGNETGIDTLSDSGSDLTAYFDWFYLQHGIMNWDERQLHAGTYRFNNNDQDFATYDHTAYFPLEEVEDPSEFTYIAPLPFAPPVLTATDTAQREALMASGVLSRDVVKFGPGLTLGDLELHVSGGDTLAVRWGNAGFDLAIPADDLGLGEGIETFQFAGGGSYSLQQILALAATTIVGTPGDDVLTGTAADELLKGLAGDDTYVYARGDGADTIRDSDGVDRVAFGMDIDPEDVSYARISGNLVLTVEGGGSVTVQGQFAEATRVEEFAFADGTVWDAAFIAAALNHAPALVAPLADQRANEYADFEFALPDGAFSDFDAEDTLAYGATLADGSALPAWLSFDNATFTFSGGPQPADAGDIAVKVTATDSYGASASDEFAIAVGMFGTEGNDFLQGSEYGELIEGYAGGDTLVGGGGDDILIGGTGGFDWLLGGEGDDTYVYEIGDGVDGISDVGGNDSVRFGEGIAPDDVLVTSDPYGALYLLAPDAGNRLELYDWLSDEQRRVESVAFADGTVWDAAELESRIATAPVTEASDILNLSDGDDVIDSLDGDDLIYGNAGNDIIAGGAGDDVLDGGTGNDLLQGGDGSDYIYRQGRAFVVGGHGDDWIDQFGDGAVIAFNPGDGNDTVYAAQGAFTLSLGGGVQPADLSVRRDGLDLVLSLSSGDSIRLTRQFEADPYAWPQITLQLFGSVHTYDFNAVISELDEEPDPGLPLPLEGVLQQHEVAVSETDALGGALAWRYATTGGFDGLSTGEKQSVLADAGFGIAAQPITVTQDMVISGGDGNDTLVGGPGNDGLDGGGGVDTMIGGAGDDAYVVDRAGDVIVENPNEGVDSAYSSATYVLPMNVEVLVLTGTAAIRGTGNDLANTIRGNDARNVLDGGGGADTLIGGAGNDTYIIDDSGDVVSEDPDEGTDTVKTSVSYALPDDVENLTLTGAMAIVGTGNAGNNVLTGNAAASVLAGGAGNDTYVIDDAAVQVLEAPSEGIDLVKASVSYVLSDNVENLTLTGAAAIDGDGNALANVLTGNSAANALFGGDGDDTLKGGAGADTLVGGAGDDVYVVDEAGDQVYENADEGIDTVKSAVDWRLGANVENLTLTGAETLNGFGNDLANVIAGNQGANLLEGYGGNDTLSGNLANDVLQGGSGNDTLRDNGGNNLLDGGAGNDKLVGNAGNEFILGGSGSDTVTTGAGSDVIAFNRGDGQDVVTASQGADNTLSLGGGIAYQDLAFKKSGSSLVLQLGLNPNSGIQEQITFNGWYSTASDNRSVARLQIVAEAMSAFDPDSGDALLAQKIQAFDFLGLVDAFNAARAANPTLATWPLSDALVAQHTGGSDTDAIGGDLAYLAGKSGSLEGMALDHAQAALDDPGFGSEPQALTPIFEGGGGDDALTGDDGSDFFAGGGGDDSIETGAGFNVIAFNAGGGTDTIYSDAGASNTLSLGGGIGYDDLSLSKAGDDLVLSGGGTDHLVLKDWYAGKDDVANLQVILDASGLYDPDSQDPLYGNKVQTFDFRGLVSQFDQARAETPGLSSWAMTNALLQWHLSHSDDAAIGGDLAYSYGRSGSLAGISVQAAQQVIGAAGFGSEAQQLHAFNGLQEGLIRLG